MPFIFFLKKNPDRISLTWSRDSDRSQESNDQGSNLHVEVEDQRRSSGELLRYKRSKLFKSRPATGSFGTKWSKDIETES